MKVIRWFLDLFRDKEVLKDGDWCRIDSSEDFYGLVKLEAGCNFSYYSHGTCCLVYTDTFGLLHYIREDKNSLRKGKRELEYRVFLQRARRTFR